MAQSKDKSLVDWRNSGSPTMRLRAPWHSNSRRIDLRGDIHRKGRFNVLNFVGLLTNVSTWGVLKSLVCTDTPGARALHINSIKTFYSGKNSIGSFYSVLEEDLVVARIDFSRRHWIHPLHKCNSDWT